MKKLVSTILAFVTSMTMLAGCGQSEKQEPSVVDQITGVYRQEVGDHSLMTIDNTDGRFRFVLRDKPLQAALGAVDEDNRTVNVNVEMKDDSKETWTIRQVFEKDKDGKETPAYHLVFTVADGTQGNFTLVRKITADDTKRLEKMYAAAEANVATMAAPIAQPVAQGTQSHPEPHQPALAPALASAAPAAGPTVAMTTVVAPQRAAMRRAAN